MIKNEVWAACCAMNQVCTQFKSLFIYFEYESKSKTKQAIKVSARKGEKQWK